ncbi:MAG: PRC and DUF2382 domain-containing protein [Actinomycetota bacterium]|nr:PRC and DUF2382 domain-containing protein [Actinomycetota bacterium]
MEREERTDRFTALEDRSADYEVYDPNGEKIGKVDDLFVDENDNPEYLGVKMGLLGMKSTLIPWEIASADEERGRIDVSVEKGKAKDGPTFDDDQDITPEYENEVRSYYGLQSLEASEEGGGYGEYYDESDEDELRVQRTEEELRAGTREREAGGLNVRKRVRTDREQLRVPKRREEVSVDRVPVEEGREVSEAEIGEDEVSMPVTEEEVVTEKRPVAKEEIRVRKDAVEDEEVVEEDVRREEVDVDDQTTGRRDQ